MTDVEICNLALAKLNNRTITSFTESSEEARICSILYNQNRDLLLRQHTWTFATKIEDLALIANEEIINFTYLYAFPTKCLYIVQIFDENKTEINNFEILLTPIENIKCIATNIPIAYIKYVKQIVDTTNYDTWFIEALVSKMASDIAMALIGSKDLANTFYELYLTNLNEAKRVNMQEQHTKQEKVSQTLEAR
jgi:hypothetical protein